MVDESLRGQYARILYHYLDGGGEAAVLQAYEFARKMLREGNSPDAIMAEHVDLVEREIRPRRGEAAAVDAQNLLLEIMMAFSMAYQQTVDDLESTNRELEQASRFKSRMLSMVAHDLTNHTMAIKLMMRAMQREGDVTRLQQRVRHVLSVIEDEEHLLGNLLDIGRIEARRLQVELQPVLLPKLVGRSVDRVRGTAGQHTFSVALPDVTVLADPAKLQQIVENLLTNAVKYSPSGGTIDISGRVERGRLEVSIQDSGLGIAAEDLPHLFEPFYRAGNAECSTIGGTGLGLAIVKSLLALQNGSIEVDSVLGQGSTFRFTLPLAASRAAGDEERARQAALD
ncbi:MAG: hypothetical protein FJX76_02485 [Armatimonadetes bacterium]|nr:hypothetical protein [Armatimonadota bacterium]